MGKQLKNGNDSCANDTQDRTITQEDRKNVILTVARRLRGQQCFATSSKRLKELPLLMVTHGISVPPVQQREKH